MKVLHLAARELRFRWGSFVLAALSIAFAVGVFVGAWSALAANEQVGRQVLARKSRETRELMAKLKDEVRRAMLRLGFNVLILPKNQDVGDWFAEDQGKQYMPEDYAKRLATSGILIVRHLLPTLQEKLFWPEAKRTVILIGTRGEVPNIFKKPRKPLLDVVAPGTMIVGYEIHKNLGLKPGDRIRFMGREFRVVRCNEQRGTKDDVSVWINLHEAQEMLGKPGKINAILALQCVCSGSCSVTELTRAIEKVLPETHAIELGVNKVLARAEARLSVAKRVKATLELEKKNRADLNRRRRIAALFVGSAVLLGAAVWIGFLAYSNARLRETEIAILRTLGYRSHQVLALVLARSVLAGAFGAAAGAAAGFTAAWMFARRAAGNAGIPFRFQVFFDPLVPLAAVGAAILLTVAAAWLPAVIAAGRDPADILRRE